MLKKVSEIDEGDTITNLGYVFSNETGNGYLSYPSSGYGMDAAMPEDTHLIVIHDSRGEEIYILAPADSEFMVRS